MIQAEPEHKQVYWSPGQARMTFSRLFLLNKQVC